MSWRSHLYSWRFRKPKRYQITYTVQLPQTSSQGFLVLPYPQTTLYQTVTDIQYHTDGKAEQRDHYIVFQGCSQVTLTGQITVTPRHLLLPEQCVKADYQAPFDGEFYCQPDRYIQSQHPQIQALAREIVGDETNLMIVVKKLYEYTIEHLQYGNAIAGLYTTTQALTESCVDCGGFATYLAALLRASHIPCRLIAGFWAGQDRNEMHAWLEYLLPDGQWVVLDPSVDYLQRHGRSSKVAGYNNVGSDRIVISVGSDHHLHIHNHDIHIGMLQTPVFIQSDGTFTYVDSYKLVST